MAIEVAAASPTDRLKVAIVGGGMIAEIHRRAAILAGADIVGVLDVDPPTTARLAERWAVERAFTDIDDVTSARPDAVHICTPNATHAPYAHAIVAAGLNVVCEKPLGITLAEAQALAAQASDQGVVAAVPFVYRFHPLVREIRARRIAGEFGQWHMLHGSYLQDWLMSPASSNWRVNAHDGGLSRAFADIGSHWCDLVEWVSGETITELAADTAIAIPHRPSSQGPTFSAQGASGSSSEVQPDAPVTTEDIVTMIFRTSHGVPGSLALSQVSGGRKNRLWFELDGATKSAVFDQENPETVWFGTPQEAQTVQRDPNHLSSQARRLAKLPAGHVQGWAYCFENFVADVYAAIRGHQPDGLPTFADGVRAMQIVDAVLASARTRSWQTIPSGAELPAIDGSAEDVDGP